jgi:group I intron endonuclease
MKFNIDESIKHESGIYIIKNTLDFKCYIGSTKDFYQRHKDHISKLNNKRHTNPRLQNFVNKYGIEILSFNILCFCSIKLLRYNEKLLIDELSPTFNIKPIEIDDLDLYDKNYEAEKAREIVNEILGVLKI